MTGCMQSAYRLIHWKGYPRPAEDTWEPLSNLINCQELILGARDGCTAGGCGRYGCGMAVLRLWFGCAIGALGRTRGQGVKAGG
eukprot:2646823-Pyramimonas_sp.AAC.1